MRRLDWLEPSHRLGYEVITMEDYRQMAFQDVVAKIRAVIGDMPVYITFDRQLACGNIHGGYWRALDKSAMMHHMADLAGTGFGIVNVNYPLCPEVTLTEIMACLNDGMAAIVAHVDAQTQPRRFILMGHSAGAHMAMHLSHHPALKDRLSGVVALSGIYETSVVRELSVNEDVRLSADEADRWDCLKQMPASGPSYYISAGGAEPSGWIDQSWIMAEALLRRGDDVHFHIAGGAHHFSLVDWLCNGHNPEGAKAASLDGWPLITPN